MADLDDLKNIVDENLKELSVSEELKQKTLARCTDRTPYKKKKLIPFRLPTRVMKPLVGLACVFILTFGFINMMGNMSMKSDSASYEKAPYGDGLDVTGEYKYHKYSEDGDVTDKQKTEQDEHKCTNEENTEQNTQDDSTKNEDCEEDENTEENE